MQRARLGLLAVCLVCCDVEPAQEPAPVEVETLEPPAPERASEPPQVEAPKVEPPEVEPPAAPKVEVDLAGIREAKVRVVAVHRDRSWTACGVIHSTGVIEVEVLEVGEPPPRIALIISCPVDWGQRELLEVGKILAVKLYARKQYWPRPPADRKLPPELPRRYVKSMAEAPVSPTSPASEPAPRSSGAPG